MAATVIKVTEEIVSCSDNGQHPLVYIKLTDGKGRCHYCGQVFEFVSPDEDNKASSQAA